MSDQHDKDIERFNKERLTKLARAEWVDAWRIAPRIMVTLYGAMVGYLVVWFNSIPTYIQRSCQEDLLLKLVDKGFDLEVAQNVACTVMNVVGGPTTATTVFVTTICGLATGIFAFYTSTGRDWSKPVLKWKWKDAKLTEEERNVQALKDEIKQKIDELD